MSFDREFNELSEDVQDELLARKLLELFGPTRRREEMNTLNKKLNGLGERRRKKIEARAGYSWPRKCRCGICVRRIE